MAESKPHNAPVIGQVKPQLPRRRTHRNVFLEGSKSKIMISTPPVQIHQKVSGELAPSTLHVMKARMAEDLVAAASTPPAMPVATEIESDAQDLWVPHFLSDGPSPPPSHVQPTTIVGNQRRPPVSLRITIGPPAAPQPQPQRPAPRSLPRLRQPTVFVDEEAAKKVTPRQPILASSIVASPEAEVSAAPAALPESRPAPQWASLGNVRSSLPRRRTKTKALSQSTELHPTSITSEEPLAPVVASVKLEAKFPTPPASPPRKPRSLGLPKLKQNSLKNRFIQEESRGPSSQPTGESKPVLIRRTSHSHNAH